MTLHHYDTANAEHVKPLNPLPEAHLGWNTSMLTALGDLQLLSRVIARLDEGKSVPVLLRQYLGSMANWCALMSILHLTTHWMV